MVKKLLLLLRPILRIMSWRDVEKLYDKAIFKYSVLRSRIRALLRFAIRIIVYLFAAWLLIEALYWMALTYGLGDVRPQGQVVKAIEDNYEEILICKNFPRCWPIIVVVWTVILDIIIIVLKALWRYALKGVRNWRRSKKGRVQCHGVISDAPIGPDEKDLLGRAEYINVVASIIRGSKTDESAKYIGLYGTWGEGKSSVIPRIQRALRYEGYSFVDFRLWEYTDRTKLPQLLFDAIASQERLRLDKTLSGLLRLFGRSLVAPTNVLANVPFIGGILSGFYEFACGQERVKEDLRLALVSHPNKIVVVLDDLDRLLADDIYELIRLIKANGDLPNVVYLVAADREYLASALASKLPAKASEQEQLEEGRRYLEKIIPIECNLPMVKEARYVGLFKALLAHEVVFPEDFDLKKYSADLIAPFLQTFRNVKRLVNAVYVQWMYQCAKASGSRPKIHIGDMIALTSIKVFARPFYDALRKNIYLIQSTAQNGNRTFGGGLSMNWVEDNFLGKCPSEYRSALLSFLAEIMQFKECGGLTTNEEDDFASGSNREKRIFCCVLPENELGQEFRLMSPRYFWNYFTSEDEGSEPSVVEVSKQFTGLLENVDEAAAYLITLYKVKKLKFFLWGVNRMLGSELNLDTIEKTLLAVSKAIEGVVIAIGDWDFAIASKSDFGSPAAAQLFKTVPRCLQKLAAIDKERIRCDKVAEFLIREGRFGIIARIILCSSGRNKYFSDEKAHKLLEIFETTVRELCERGALAGYPDELAIRKAWVTMSINDAAWCRRMACSILNEARKGASFWNAIYPFIRATKRMRAGHIACFNADWLSKVFVMAQLVELSNLIHSRKLASSWEKSLCYSVDYILDKDCYDHKISRLEQEEYIWGQFAAEKVLPEKLGT